MSVEYLKYLLRTYHHSFRVIHATDIQEGVLEQEGVDLLIIPGGKAKRTMNEIGAAGLRKIEAFVEGGGGYIGICAGSYFATQRVHSPHVDHPSDIGTRRWGLGLFDGSA